MLPRRLAFAIVLVTLALLILVLSKADARAPRTKIHCVVFRFDQIEGVPRWVPLDQTAWGEVDCRRVRRFR